MFQRLPPLLPAEHMADLEQVVAVDDDQYNDDDDNDGDIDDDDGKHDN